MNMKLLRGHGVLVLIGLAALTPWRNAVAAPSCSSMPCGAYKNTNMTNNRTIKLSFYTHKDATKTTKLYDASYAITDTNDNYAQMGRCAITEISSDNKQSTLICYPPGYDGPSVDKKNGGLKDMCNGQTPSQCKIAKISLTLPKNSQTSQGSNCTNPNGAKGCPPKNTPVKGSTPQPSILNVKVVNVEKGKSGIGPNCPGCIDLTTGETFQVDYQCFDPACC
jgi:hypothetical protein